MALNAQAKRLFDQNKFAESIEVLGRVLTANAYDETALRLRAISQMQLNRAGEARADLDHLIQLKPDDVMALSLRGVALASLKLADQGMRDVEHALAVDPNSAMALYLPRIDQSSALTISRSACRSRSLDRDQPEGQRRFHSTRPDTSGHERGQQITAGLRSGLGAEPIERSGSGRQGACVADK
jgi:tetratricopeptide (TPR) repeat protein